MKKLKILIITERENLYLPAVKLASMIVSSFEQSADFFYIKSFDDALKPEQEQPMVNGNYDIILMFAGEQNFPTLSVIDNLWIASETSPSFFISTSPSFVEEVKKEYNVSWSYVLNDKGIVSSDDFQSMRLHISDRLMPHSL